MFLSILCSFLCLQHLLLNTLITEIFCQGIWYIQLFNIALFCIGIIALTYLDSSDFIPFEIRGYLDSFPEDSWWRFLIFLVEGSLYFACGFTLYLVLLLIQLGLRFVINYLINKLKSKY